MSTYEDDASDMSNVSVPKHVSFALGLRSEDYPDSYLHVSCYNLVDSKPVGTSGEPCSPNSHVGQLFRLNTKLYRPNWGLRGGFHVDVRNIS
jgi:hypothetical protein